MIKVVIWLPGPSTLDWLYALACHLVGFDFDHENILFLSCQNAATPGQSINIFYPPKGTEAFVNNL